METKQVTDIRIVEDIYNSQVPRDFDPKEIRPWPQNKLLFNKNEYLCYVLMEGEAILGYAFFVRKGSNYLFDYFAIKENCRNRGLGSFFLKQLAGCLRDAACIVGEVEDPDKAGSDEERLVRERRLQFYLRSGYRKTDVVSRVFGVDFRVLEVPTGTEHTSEELYRIYSDIYRGIFPFSIFEEQFRAEVLSGSGR